MESGHLRSYAEIFEDVLKQLHRDVVEESKRLSKDSLSLTREEIQKRYGVIGEKSRETLHIFPYIMRNSLFITLYSLLEHELDHLCRYLCEEYNYSIKFSDYREKNGIQRAKCYLKKIARIDFPDKTSSWDSIANYNRIRNLIVHNNGKLDATQNAKKVRDFIERSSLIEITESTIPSLYELEPRIQFNEGFHNEVIDTLEIFLGELWEVLRKKGIK